MTTRNYNNVTTIGQLTGPISSSATSVSVQDFTQYPATPFTATIDRNTATEEIVLVTGVAGTVATISRGYDGTAAIGHLAGATFEHTAVAADFTEANAHVNATTGVHGTAGELVGSEGAQTILDKTLVSPVLQADLIEGDAIVAEIPSGAGARNLFRGVGTDGLDKIVIDSSGNIVAAGAAVSGAIAAATAAATANQLAKRDASGDAAFRQVTVSQDPSTGNALTRKSYVDAAITTGTSSKAATTYVDSQDTATLNAAKAYTDAHTTDSGWATASLASGWSAGTAGVKYRKINGVVYVNFQTTRTGATFDPFTGTLIFTLPTGYRPGMQTFFTSSYGDTAHGELNVQTNGQVELNGSTLNGQQVSASLSFPADN